MLLFIRLPHITKIFPYSASEKALSFVQIKENSMQQVAAPPEDETSKAIEIISTIEHDPNYLVKILQEIQAELGYVPETAQRLLAKKMRMPVSHIYGILSFYNFFRLYPPGRHRVTVCLGTACYVKGSRNILKEITSRYELEPGQTTSDRRFSLDIVRCVGCCAIGPVMTVNDRVYGRMKPEKVKTVLREFK
jgi:NADP-reducing hydrogenase subunit HndA